MKNKIIKKKIPPEVKLTKAIGSKFKKIRLEMEVKQELLRQGICSKHTIINIENGDSVYINIDTLITLASKLGVELFSILEVVMFESNSVFALVYNIFKLVSNHDFDQLKLFCNLEKNKKVIDSEVTLSRYIVNSILLHNKNYLLVISNLEKVVTKYFDFSSVCEVMLTDCFLSACYAVYHQDKSRIIRLNNLVRKHEKEVDSYLIYYPEIFIKLKTNLANFYRIIGEVDHAKKVLSEMYDKCHLYNLYEFLTDIHFGKLDIILCSNNIDEIKIQVKKIEACFLVINKLNKNDYYRNKLESLELSEFYVEIR